MAIKMDDYEELNSIGNFLCDYVNKMKLTKCTIVLCVRFQLSKLVCNEEGKYRWPLNKVGAARSAGLPCSWKSAPNFQPLQNLITNTLLTRSLNDNTVD